MVKPVINNLPKNQSGGINVLLFPFIFAMLLLIAAASFAVWAYNGRQDYKNNSDQKSAVAVTSALKTEDAKKDAQFFEDAKKPLKTYVGPSAYGSLHLSYPKTWSAYIDESDNSNTDLNGYFYPDFVPALLSGKTYALRVQIVNTGYASVLSGYAGGLTRKEITVAPYTLPSVKTVVGSRIDGLINRGVTGSIVLLPLRDKTLEISTEASSFENDFNTNILPNVSFSP